MDGRCGYVLLLKFVVHAGDLGSQNRGHANGPAESNGTNFYTQQNISPSALSKLGGWIGFNVKERTASVQVIYGGKPLYWPLIGLSFAKRSEAQHLNVEAKTGPAGVILTEPWGERGCFMGFGLEV